MLQEYRASESDAVIITVVLNGDDPPDTRDANIWPAKNARRTPRRSLWRYSLDSQEYLGRAVRPTDHSGEGLRWAVCKASLALRRKCYNGVVDTSGKKHSFFAFKGSF